MKFTIGDIRANPFRHIDRYPIREDKITALRESLRTTGFWDNVVARKGPDGTAQIAYGHHRLEALRREYDPNHQVNLIIRDLSDEQMLKIMARENMEEWGTSAMVEQETVRAVVEAFADRRIELDPPDAKANSSQLRYAPAFVSGDARREADTHPYTAQTVANFLGWTEPGGMPQDKVRNALAALAFIEDGTLTEEDFAGLTTEQARAVVEQARRAKATAELQAKEARQRADRAQRDAAKAEAERARAERERERREAQAVRARDDAARRRAEEQAQEERRREAAAAKAQREAERRQQAAQREAESRRKEGRKEASKTGRHVSKALRGGAGYKQASEIAAEVRGKPREEQPPPHIDQYASRLASKLNKILDPADDQLAKELDVLIRFQSNMSAASFRGLLLALDNIAKRVEAYRQRLIGPASATTSIPPTPRELEAST